MTTDTWTCLAVSFDAPARGDADEAVGNLLACLPTAGAEHAAAGTRIVLKAYFEPRDVTDELRRTLAHTAAQLGLGACRIDDETTVPRENWNENWKEFFHPVRVSPRLCICPPWEKPEGVEAIVIDPGMAFGTGTHETTRLILGLCEKHLRPGESVLDCGTGSGILCLAAAKLGAGTVAGFDLDPLVIPNLSDNLRLNEIPAGRIHFVVGPLECLRERPYGLILCNMLIHEFLPLIPLFPRYASPQTRIILSGYLLTEKEEAVSAATAAGFRAVDFAEEGEWGGMVVEPRP